MDTAIKTNTRNLTLECCKLMAACFVVFLHIPFPGDFGALVVCLSRFAVPLFFAVSGWYSYEAAPKKLARRLANILLLELMGDVLYIGWRCIREVLSGEVLLGSLVNQVPDGQAMKLWLLWNVDPFAGHLWYLSATALCYILLLLYHPLRNKSRGYQPLYFLGGILLAGCFCMGEFSGFTGISVDFRVCRSGIFTGFPLFLMGLLLRQYRLRLRGLPLAAVGVSASILEWQWLGSFELYLGSVLTAAGILLLADRHPQLPGRWSKTAASFGRLSTVIYLVHLLVQEAYIFFLYQKMVLPESAESWLRPVLILVLSALAGLICEAVRKRGK